MSGGSLRRTEDSQRGAAGYLVKAREPGISEGCQGHDNQQEPISHPPCYTWVLDVEPSHLPTVINDSLFLSHPVCANFLGQTLVTDVPRYVAAGMWTSQESCRETKAFKTTNRKSTVKKKKAHPHKFRVEVIHPHSSQLLGKCPGHEIFNLPLGMLTPHIEVLAFKSQLHLQF